MPPLTSRLLRWPLLTLALYVPAQPALAQTALLDRLRALGVDSVEAGIRVYHTPGHAARAGEVGPLIAAAQAFYRDSLGVEAPVRLAVLDSAQWAGVAGRVPYGLPFVDSGVAFLPALRETGAVRGMFVPYLTGFPADARHELERAGLSPSAAVDAMVDLIGLHELGHVLTRAYGIDPRQQWFNEFLATYLAYAFLRHHAPALATAYDAPQRAVVALHTPTHRTLDDLNRLYIGVGVTDYGWYQSALQERVRDVYEAQGVSFLPRVRERLMDTALAPASADELLGVLEAVAPGFEAWAARLHR